MHGGDVDAVAAVLALGALVFGGGLIVGLAILAVVSWLVSTCYKRIPAQFREMEPGMVWLLMIPCFHVVWNFFVFPKLARSYQAYFASVGRTDVGDCGAGLAMAYCVCAACALISFVPYIGCLGLVALLAALVLLIIVLVKAWDLKNRIPESTASAPPPGPPTA